MADQVTVATQIPESSLPAQSAPDDLSGFVVKPESASADQSQIPQKQWGTFTSPEEAANAYSALLPDYTKVTQERSRLTGENEALRNQLNQLFMRAQAPTAAPDQFQDPTGYQRYLETMIEDRVVRGVEKTLGVLIPQATKVQNEEQFYREVKGIPIDAVRTFMLTYGIDETKPGAYVNAYQWMTMPQRINTAVQTVTNQNIAQAQKTNAGAQPIRGAGATPDTTTFSFEQVADRVAKGDGMAWLKDMDKKHPGFEGAFFKKVDEIRTREIEMRQRLGGE